MLFFKKDEGGPMPKIVDRDAMQAQIIEAAFRCFADQGFHATKMTDVAREAGLAKGTLYLYFSSKDALAVEMVHAQFAQYAKGLDAPVPDSLAAFLARVRQGMVMSQADPGASRLFFDLLGPGFSNDAVRDEIGGFFARLGESYGRQMEALRRSGALREDLDCAATGAALASMLDGLVMHSALFGLTQAEFDRRLDAALLLFKAGLSP